MGRKMTVAQAAEAAQCSIETIRRAIRRKELAATHHPTKPGRPYQIDATDLNALLEKRRVA